MKLRTEMQNGCVHANGYCVDEDAVDIRQAERLVHDTAVAHALMRALVEVSEKGEYVFPTNALIAVKRRADKLMRSWGFDAREDA